MWIFHGNEIQGRVGTQTQTRRSDRKYGYRKERAARSFMSPHSQRCTASVRRTIAEREQAPGGGGGGGGGIQT